MLHAQISANNLNASNSYSANNKETLMLNPNLCNVHDTISHHTVSCRIFVAQDSHESLMNMICMWTDGYPYCSLSMLELANITMLNIYGICSSYGVSHGQI